MASEPSGRRYAPIGKYDLLAHIATGGMGVVYKAVDQETGQIVALKVLSPALSNRPNVLERFRREANRGIKLRHENLVAIYEFGEDRGISYLALEFVDGSDLSNYLTLKGPLDPDEACMLLSQAARALDYLYQQQVVHRDIKPSNFLLTEVHGQPLLKLSDLGLARDINDEDFRVTQAGHTVGTIDYMAPEQARDSGLADIRSDLYSLGCTFYHMLAGRAPFAEGGLAERLYKHAEDVVPDVRPVNPRVSLVLMGLLRRLLSKKPADRYQTPAELLEDLARLKRGETLAPPNRSSGAAIPVSGQRKVPGRSTATSTQASTATVEPSLFPALTPEQHRAAFGQFERANQVIATGNLDYGIHLLLACCKLDPGNLAYRQALRRSEKLKFQDKKRSSWLAWLFTLKPRTRLKAARQGGDFVKVLEYGEEILVRNPWDQGVLMDMAEAADKLGRLDLAIWILKEAWHRTTHTPPLNQALAKLYEKRGEFREASALWKLVVQADPQNIEAHRQIKNLAAKETIVRGQYEEAAENKKKEDE